MKRPAYPTYRESGIRWLGSVPAGWPIDRLKWTVEGCYNGVWGDEPDGENDFICIRVADFDRVRNRIADAEYTYRAVEPKQRNSRALANGDLLIEKSGGGEGQPVGVVVLFDKNFPAVCSNFVARMPVRRAFEPSFLCYLHSAIYASRLNVCSIKQNTGIQNLDSSAYLDERAAFPSQTEQVAITSFLDRETAKLDTLITKQERLIELLQEKRQAVISHAVAKGLNPKASMKDSGVEWLGRVPAHWETPPMRAIANVVRGASPRPAGDLRYFGGDAIPWITVAEITKDDTMYVSDTAEGLTAVGREFSRVFPAGTLLFSNSGATLGVPKICSMSACANDGVVGFLSLDQRVNIEFLYFFLLTTTKKLRDEIKQGAGQPNLNTSIVKGIRMGMPPLPEQLQIVEHIKRALGELDKLIAKSRCSIDLMREHRSALISAAVTGKIDVRKAA